MIRTCSGKFIDYEHPATWIDNIDIMDIAHSLSKICRFTGHCNRFYSVAEHSVNGTYAPELTNDYDRLGFLLHDAHEAYLGDINTPLKRYLLKASNSIYRIADAMDRAIFDTFKLDISRVNWDTIRTVDARMLETEAWLLVEKWNASQTVKPYELHYSLPRYTITWDAEDAFLDRFNELILKVDIGRLHRFKSSQC